MHLQKAHCTRLLGHWLGQPMKCLWNTQGANRLDSWLGARASDHWLAWGLRAAGKSRALATRHRPLHKTEFPPTHESILWGRGEKEKRLKPGECRENIGKVHCGAQQHASETEMPESPPFQPAKHHKESTTKLLKKQEQEALKKQKKEELEKRKLQKEQEKREKEEERKERERLKLAKKEQEEKEKQQKLKEKEEQKKQRQLMIEMKQEEKKKKEEMRLKREEEKKKAEEEKRKAELEKKKEKQEKAKAAFVKFFKKTVPTTSAVQVTETEGAFKPFQVSEDMTLAPVVPPVAQKRFNKEMLDRGLQKQGDTKLYLSILKCENYKDIRLRKRLRKQRTCDAEVIVFDNKTAAELFLNAKLLQFCENLRPAYWGTWRKKSKNIGPRKPFGKDDIFDYEVDSDDEWDEGGPGESLSGTENEMSSEDEYEVDNEFFVPHGYLSPEEEKEEDEVMNKENKQALLKLKQQEFEFERKKKTTELKPIILGCYFENIAESQDSSLGTILLQYAAEILSEGPIPTSFTIKKLQVESAPNSNVSSPSNIVKKKKISPVPEEAMPYLIRLLHGNAHGCDILIKEFQAFWQQHCQDTPDSENALADEVEKSAENCSPKTPEVSTKNISKRQLKLVIKKISSWGKSPNPALKKICWWVNDEVREKYGLLDAPIPNQWVMSTIPASDAGTPTTVKNNPSIKEFLLS
ncbi:chromatin assembly factor 1 subunit A [Caerostris extrusa]|uniref:Chromatin assembly factor 1 subunit A n=1 Tax=Caerostris extrusa TaxID=172846 RepID=A0AAV4M5U5_CAEEX|nr:chromatin assembly factor 1 subunit A [Caerostris extrusa]